MARIEGLSRALADNAEEIAQQCGAQVEYILRTSAVLHSQTCTLGIVLVEIANLMTCSNWNSLYADVAYNAICYNGTTGLVWVSSCQFVIVFFALIMLTLRDAFYELNEEDEKDLEKHRKCLTSCLCCMCCRRKEKDAVDPVQDGVADEDKGDAVDPAQDGVMDEDKGDAVDPVDDQNEIAVEEKEDKVDAKEEYFT